ncbi:undecaprenyldiphospho-muramoylpentapeptide beta-N-acetylglucosaminyltransferase [Jonesiaceae bacterium BS-20]|uniref:UDP-N-acetylglucosamine--N-acetylmuramyl-(pentapeptide) pyrophosphoryl-undecaprenol N-acetylglucosamine transferase n=1 Tax=Jonesiaceae bacterium BS-20 TaxID=3120821 RepID=A0AAU7DXX2_9MICO
MSKSILLAGGGTAGHVNPLLAVADQIRATYPDAVIRVLGTKEGLESDLVPARGFDLDLVPRVPMPRKPSPAWFTLPKNLNAAVRAARETMVTYETDVVIGFGGYVSTPAYLAARKLGVPVVIQEQNARPGLANRLGARWASAISTTFAQTALKGAQVTGLPLRHEIADLADRLTTDRAAVRSTAAQELGLDPARPILVVTGGSLGALSLNTAVSRAAGQLLAQGMQILHLTGRGKSGPVLAAISDIDPTLRPDYHVLEYLAQMDLAYAVADLVVCRSGAGTVCELAALGVPAIFVPLPIGNGEQRLNAMDMVNAGGALLVADQDLTAQWLVDTVNPLLVDGQKLAAMSASARSVGQPDAAQKIVALVAQAAGWEKK